MTSGIHGTAHTVSGFNGDAICLPLPRSSRRLSLFEGGRFRSLSSVRRRFLPSSSATSSVSTESIDLGRGEENWGDGGMNRQTGP